MKWWLHLLAALAGLAVAALIVMNVFGSADREGSRAGTAASAPTTVARGASGATKCGSVPPSRKPTAAARRIATTVLPAVYAGSTQRVTVTSATQRAWFAWLQAASGMCVVQVDVYAKQLSASAYYPAKIPAARRNAYTMTFLAAAFRPPLSRDIVQLRSSSAAGGGTSHLIVAQSTWRAFHAQRAGLHLPNNLAGLSRYGHKVQLAATELTITGFPGVATLH